MNRVMSVGPHRQAGLTYVETLLAVLILASCLVPAMQAIRDNLARPAELSKAGEALACLKQATERILAEPYDNLRLAATSQYAANQFSKPSGTYSMPPDDVCNMQRDAYILRYDPGLANPYASLSDDVLYVRVEIPGFYNFATLATRK